jgi:hypothetical protein
MRWRVEGYSFKSGKREIMIGRWKPDKAKASGSAAWWREQNEDAAVWIRSEAGDLAGMDAGTEEVLRVGGIHVGIGVQSTSHPSDRHD